MCGIAGSSDIYAIEDVNFLTSEISHRGPDDLKVQTFQQGIFGFARLSIIDLKDGNQPIQSLCSGNAIILNGEIYNYKKMKAKLENTGHVFCTNSDAEW
jgi:asparagine synthase (glutamine-hydrolysing)